MKYRVRFPCNCARWVSTSVFDAAGADEALMFFTRIHHNVGPISLYNDSAGSVDQYIVDKGRAYTLAQWAIKNASERDRS